MDLMVFSLHVAGLSSLVGSLNFIVTFMRYFLFSFFSLFGFIGFINDSLAYNPFFQSSGYNRRESMRQLRCSFVTRLLTLRSFGSLLSGTNEVVSSNFLVYNY